MAVEEDAWEQACDGDLTCAIGASCPRLGRQADVATLSLARAMVALAATRLIQRKSNEDADQPACKSGKPSWWQSLRDSKVTENQLLPLFRGV